MKANFILFILLFSFVSSLSVAKEMETATDSEELKSTIDALLKVEPSSYFSQIDSYLEKIDKYILRRKGVCNGDFSVIVLEENSGEKVEKRRKLSHSERRLCLSELKNLRILYVNNLFIARKKYLDYLHDRRIKQLIKIKEDVLKEIQGGGKGKR